MVSKSDSDYSANVNWANKLVVKPAHTSRRMALILMQNAINMCVCCLDDGIQDKSSHGRLRKRKANQTFMIKEWVFLEGFYRNVFWVARYFVWPALVMMWCALFQCLLKLSYFFCCTGKTRMMMISKRVTKKCPGKGKLTIFSAGRVWTLLCSEIVIIIRL